MPASRANLTIVHLPLEVLIETARQLARHEEYILAESLLRCALVWDEDNSSARRWLEFSLEAQGKFNEAYFVHIQKKAGVVAYR